MGMYVFIYQELSLFSCFYPPNTIHVSLTSLLLILIGTYLLFVGLNTTLDVVTACYPRLFSICMFVCVQ